MSRNLLFPAVFIAFRVARAKGFRYSCKSFVARLSANRFPMKTISANAQTVKRDWFIVDASGKTLGRLATELARRLRGKHKTVYTPHADTGDYLVVVNAEKVAVTGNK